MSEESLRERDHRLSVICGRWQRSMPAAVFVALTLVAADVTRAQPEAASTPPLSGSLDGSVRAAIASSDRLLDDRTGLAPLSLALRGRFTPADEARAVFDAVLGNRVQAGLSGRGIVREAYVEGRRAGVEVGVGRQAFAWGRADAINPTDYFGARDYTRMVDEDDEQRRGVDVVRARYAVGSQATLQLVYEPRVRPTLIPLRERPGVRYDAQTSGETRPSWAIKYDVEGAGGVDASVSYFHGQDRLPDLTPLGVGASGLRVGLLYPRVSTLGADFSIAVANLVLRGELAYQRTPDTDGQALFVRNRQFFAVFGVERRWGDDVSVFVQIFAKRVFGFRAADAAGDPASAALARAGFAVVDQVSARRAGVTVKVVNKWSQAWSGELAVLAAWPQRDSIWRPRLVYRPHDHWRITAGADLFRGPAASTFGQLRDNSHATLAIAYFF